MDHMEPDERMLGASADDELLSDAAADDDSDAPVRLDENAHGRENGHGEENGHAHDNGHLPAGMLEGGDVRAENVTLSQGGARDIEATTVSITQGGAAQVRAQQMTLSQGGVAVARTESLTVGEGGSAFAVMSDQATINDGGNVLLLVAGEVSGDARPVLDWRAALAFAVGLVVAWRLVRRVL
jgi:hypothetical protein